MHALKRTRSAISAETAEYLLGLPPSLRLEEDARRVAAEAILAGPPPAR